MCAESWRSGFAKINECRITRGSTAKRNFWCSDVCVLRYTSIPLDVKKLVERIKEGLQFCVILSNFLTAREFLTRL